MLWAHRVRWLLLLLTYYVLLWAIRVVPYVGPFVPLMLKPVFAVGFLAAAWSQERGRLPALRHLLAGFHANLRALLLLGIVFVAGMTGAVFATWLVDGGKLLEVMSGAATLDEAFLADANVDAAMLFGALCALPVLLASWFAPALRAAMANWRPIAMYALLLFLYVGVLPTFVAAIIAALLPEDVAYIVAKTVLLPYLALLVATVHISDYVSYRDIFHPDERLPAFDAHGSDPAP